MNTQQPVRSRALRAAVCIAFLVLVSMSQALAQGSPCTGGGPPLTLNNLTACFINICVVDNLNGNGAFTCHGVAAGGAVQVPVRPGATVVGIMNWCCFYGFMPNGAPPPNWWVPNVTLAPGCCCDVMYDETTCTINVVPTVVPPPCRP